MDLKPELFKAILQWVKDNLPNEKNEIYDASDIVIPPYTKEEIRLHVDLLTESGYFKVSPTCDKLIFRLSMQGYNMLEVMNNNNIWEKIKKVLADLGVLALPTLAQIAFDQLKLLLK